MATVTGLTADRMLAIEAASVVDGDVVGDNLILTKHDGSQINAGSVRGPQGVPGPVGQDLSVVAARSILDVGILNQIRAGRQLSATDFANLGLAPPLGLWNLSDLSDASGSGRPLLNKGAVPFGQGINGVAATAAQFAGAPAQFLYIPDSGAADTFRIRTGTIGCWFKTAKRGVDQTAISKWGASPNLAWWLGSTATGPAGVHVAKAYVSSTGTDLPAVNGVTEICDDRWHFIAFTIDGSMIRLYVDGLLENCLSFAANAYPGSGVFNIGAQGGDASTNGSGSHFGRVDEAFITSSVLNEVQMRNLYCARITHTLTTLPTRVSLNVRQRRKGGALSSGDFPTAPLRLHNFSAGSLNDEGSNNVPLINNGGAISVAGVDGAAGNAFSLANTANLSATDAGLPAGVTSRSFGGWFKSASTVACTIIGWGTVASADARLVVQATGDGKLWSYNGADGVTGPFVLDGFWHFIVEVDNNVAMDGIKRKIYVDGRLSFQSAVLNPITLAGANRFRIGAGMDGANPFTGHVDSGFVCDYALTAEQIGALYLKSAVALAASPKGAGDHVEAMSTTDLLCVFDSLDGQHQIDLAVA